MKTIKIKIQVIFYIFLILFALSYPNIVYPAGAGKTKEVWLIGSQNRVKLVSEFIVDNFGNKVKINSEIKDTIISGEKGVQLYWVAPEKAGGSYTFIQLRDKRMNMKNPILCEGQGETLDVSLIQLFSSKLGVKKVIVDTSTNARFCGCVVAGEVPTPPFRLRSNYEGETINLNFPRQKRILLFWLEDNKGRKIYMPDAKISLTDINQSEGNEVNYEISQFDPTTCTTWFVKWWDRIKGAGRGRLHKSGEVFLDNGMMKVSVVLKGSEISTLSFPWKVQYSELREKTREKDLKVDNLVIIFKDSSLTGQLSRGSIEDRLVEIVSFDGQKSWQTIARNGKFEVKDILVGEYLLQVFNFPKDEKEALSPQLEFEEIISF